MEKIVVYALSIVSVLCFVSAVMQALCGFIPLCIFASAVGCMQVVMLLMLTSKNITYIRIPEFDKEL